MRIGLIDADLIARKKHRFPNLCQMKLSGYWKEQGAAVTLLTEYDYFEIASYDKVFVSMVFTDTEYPDWLLSLPNVEYGGTGFFFDKAPNLPCEIEHHMPDYHLYDEWVEQKIAEGFKKSEFKEYTDYSIGYLTRGCFRKCGFCVNQKYDRVYKASALSEFLDPTRKKICLLDDNFFGCPQWKEMLEELISTGKPFKFKQGLDERLLTDEKCEMLFSAKYDSDITFAFDRIEDYDLIESKLKMIRRHTPKQMVFYVLVGFDETGVYDEAFWRMDMVNMFRRINLLRQYRCCPYIMRFNKYKDAPPPYLGMYITVARWCNQFSFFKKNSLRQYCCDVKSNGEGTAPYRYLKDFEKRCADIAKWSVDEKNEEW